MRRKITRAQIVVPYAAALCWAAVATANWMRHPGEWAWPLQALMSLLFLINGIMTTRQSRAQQAHDAHPTEPEPSGTHDDTHRPMTP